MKPEACFQFYKYLLSGSGESFAQHSNQKYFKQDFILSTVSTQQNMFTIISIWQKPKSTEQVK